MAQNTQMVPFDPQGRPLPIMDAQTQALVQLDGTLAANWGETLGQSKMPPQKHLPLHLVTLTEPMTICSMNWARIFSDGLE